MLKLLQNMNLATDNGSLNLACVLLFTERPEWIKPQFILKAVRYPGNEIHVTEYLDTEDRICVVGQAIEVCNGHSICKS
jgi:ATP-dependent DNA helicase RecG